MAKRRLTRTILILLGLCLLAGGAVLWLERDRLLYQPISQAIVRPALEGVFRRPVQYSKMRGSLLGGIVLEDVVVPRGQTLAGPTVLEAPLVKIRYNLLKMAARPKDIIGAVYAIDLIKPKIYLEHDAKDHWNILDIFLAEGGAVPPFYAKLRVQDGQLEFVDRHGFQARPPARTFRQSASRVDGWIDFHKNPLLEFEVGGQLDQDGSGQVPARISFKGTINSSKVKFALYLKTQKLPLAGWYDYAVGIPWLSLSAGTVDLDLEFADKPHAGPLPCLIAGTISTSQAKAVLAGLPGPLSGIDGRIKLTKSDLVFDDLKARLGDVPITVNGPISGYQEYDLKVKTPDSPVSAWSSLITSLPADLLVGRFNNDLKITGPTSDPHLKGQMSCRQLDLNFLTLTDAKIAYDYQGDRWQASLASARSLGGRLKGQADLDLTGPEPDYRLTLDLKDLNLAKLSYISGAGLASGRIEFVGRGDQAAGRIELVGTKTALWGQPIDDLSGQIGLAGPVLKLTDILISQRSGRPAGNDQTGTLALSGDLDQKGDYKLTVIGKDLYLDQKLPVLSEADNQGLATFSAQVQGRLPARRAKQFDYQADLQGELQQPIILGQPFLKVQLDSRFTPQGALLKKLQFASPFSRLALWGDIPYGSDLDLNWEGRVRIEEFTGFFKKIFPFLLSDDRISGEMTGAGRLAGRWPQVRFNGQSRMRYFSFNDVVFSLIDIPSFRWQDDTFSLEEKPAAISFGQSTLALLGRIKLAGDQKEGLPAKNGQAPWLNGSCRIESGQLKEIVQQVQALYRQLSQPGRRVFPEIFLPNQPIALGPLQAFRLPPGGLKTTADGRLELYQDPPPVEPGSQNLLTDFQKIRDEVQTRKTGLASWDWSKGLAGAVQGQLVFSVFDDRMSGGLDLEIAQGQLQALDFSRLILSADFGQYQAGSRRSEPWPFFPLSVSWQATDGHLLSAKFDNLAGQIRTAGSDLIFQDFTFNAGHSQAVLAGSLPLNRTGSSYDLELKTSGDSVRILAAFFKEIAWLQGTGNIDLRLTGPWAAPRLDGRLVLRDAAFDLKTPAKSQIKNLNADISLDDGVGTIKKLNAHWQGETTLQKDNYLEVSGRLVLANLLRSDWHLDFQQVQLQDNTYYLNLPDFFSGAVTTSGLKIDGRLDASLIKPNGARTDLIRPHRPVTLLGAIYVAGGRLTIPTGQTSPLPDIGLGLDLTWGNDFRLLANNLEINQGDTPLSLTQLAFLNSLNFRLAPSDVPVTLRGSFRSPVLESRLLLSDGSFNFLGRNFNLISPARQRQFVSNRSFAETNYLVLGLKQNFLGQPAAQDIEVNMTAEAILPETINPTNGAYQKRSLLVFLSGSLDRTQIFFEQYDQLPSGRWELAARYDLAQLTQVIRLILPSYISTRLDNLASRQLLADLTSQQMQALFRQTLQPLEERLAQAVGLEEFQFDYNLGYRLSRGIFPETTAPANAQIIGITAAKRLFFDRLYVRVNLSEDLRSLKQGDIAIPQIDYQISYWLNDNLSADYTRENIKTGPNLQGYDIYSIQYRYRF